MDDPLPQGLVEEIQRVIATDPVGPGADLYHAVFDSGILFPLQRRQEMAMMMHVARTIAPRRIMEIGTDKGGGAYHWIKGLCPDVFIGIEVRGVPYAETFQDAFPKTHQKWFGASSYAQQTVQAVERALYEAPIDVLFIDGDKAQFYQDFLAYLPMVRLGGIVFMHDPRDEVPGAAYKVATYHPRVVNSLRFESTLEVVEAVLREQARIEPANPHEGWLRHWRGQSCGVGVLWV